MAFIVLRRSRNRRSYYLVESYRDEKGRSRKRTLCYLGRERDGTDTIERAIDHWETIRCSRFSLRDEKRRASEKVKFLRGFLKGSLRKTAPWKPSREESPLWDAIRRAIREPTKANGSEAKKAFRILAKKHHPDHGGSKTVFIELRTLYERALIFMGL